MPQGRALAAKAGFEEIGTSNVPLKTRTFVLKYA
jgi:hypothetical protein